MFFLFFSVVRFGPIERTLHLRRGFEAAVGWPLPTTAPAPQPVSSMSPPRPLCGSTNENAGIFGNV